MTESPLLESSIALAAYAEPLAANRRVLVFGSALGALALQLLERGARAVHVCDPDSLAVAEATARNRSSQVTFSALAESDLSVRDGAFELALIDDLGAFDPLSILRKAHRALVSRGVAVVACPNPEAAFPLLRAKNRSQTALDYYALYDAVAAEFEHVRMLGQTPFVGYAIADFSAAGEPEPALDTSFVPGGAEEPDVFIALAAGHEVRLDEFAVVQLPTRQILRSVSGAKNAGPAQAQESPPPAKVDPRELARLNDWIRELEARASTADERADHTETELEDARSELTIERDNLAAQKSRSNQELLALRAELSEKQTRHEQELQSARSDAAAKHGRKEQELVALHAEGAAKHSRHEQELLAARADLSAREAELVSVRAELAQRDRQRSEQAARVDRETNSELAEFERQLSERGLEVRRLEGELRTLERTGRELVRDLERARGEQTARANAELERTLAEREADLQAAAWTIESLSLQLELAGGPHPAHESEPKTPLSDAEAR